SYRFSEAYDTLYHFVWDDLADWYIEASKAEENKPLLALVLESVLKIAHPFAPFLTETIWQTLAWEEGSILATAEWPAVPQADAKRAAAFESVKEVITEARAVLKAVSAGKTTLFYAHAPLLAANAPLIIRLARR